MPPTVTVFPPISTCTAAYLGFVSVVMMAFAASSPASSVSAFAFARSATPSRIWSMGSCIPMTPVDATSTEDTGTRRSLSTACAVCSQ